jgi:hypothetical protein
VLVTRIMERARGCGWKPDASRLLDPSDGSVGHLIDTERARKDGAQWERFVAHIAAERQLEGFVRRGGEKAGMS